MGKFSFFFFLLSLFFFLFMFQNNLGKLFILCRKSRNKKSLFYSYFWLLCLVLLTCWLSLYPFRAPFGAFSDTERPKSGPDPSLTPVSDRNFCHLLALNPTREESCTARDSGPWKDFWPKAPVKDSLQKETLKASRLILTGSGAGHTESCCAQKVQRWVREKRAQKYQAGKANLGSIYLLNICLYFLENLYVALQSNSFFFAFHSPCFPFHKCLKGVSVKKLESGIKLNPEPCDSTSVMDILHRLSIP